MSRDSAGEYQADEQAVVPYSAGEYQADKQACVARLHWRLVGYSPWGHKELDTTERLSTHTHR